MPNSIIPTCHLTFPVQVPSRRPVNWHISGLPLLRWPSDFPYFWWLWQHEGIALGHLVYYLTLGLFFLRFYMYIYFMVSLGSSVRGGDLPFISCHLNDTSCWHDQALLMLTLCPARAVCGSPCHREAGGSFPISPWGRQSGSTAHLAWVCSDRLSSVSWEQWSSTFLTLRSFNTVPHAVETSAIKLFHR